MIMTPSLALLTVLPSGKKTIKICQVGLIQTIVSWGLVSLRLGQSNSRWGILDGKMNNRSLKLDGHLEDTDSAWVTKEVTTC